MPPPTASDEAMLATADGLARLARAAREAAGLSQQRAADLLGVKQPTVAQAEGEPDRPLTRLRIQMIERFGTNHVAGPYWIVTPGTRPHDPQ